MTTIKYQEGTGKGNRAAFICGKASLPTSIFTRLQKDIEGKSDTAKTRIFISKLAIRHGEFLDALEKAGIGYLDAITKMVEVAPIKQKSTPRLSKEAAAVAKMLCRKYSGKTGAEMVTAFVETANRPEFASLVVEITAEYEEKYGRNTLGRIRVRPERKDLAGIAAKARAGRKKK